MPEYRFSGDRLRAHREHAKKTRTQLGADIDRSDSLICLFELGYREPPADKLVELAAVLGVRVEDFFMTEVPA
jgi:transcriptional regulator with XRE-family HTH domain